MSHKPVLVLDDELNPPKLILDDEERVRKIEKELSCLTLPSEVCQRIRNVFKSEMSKGLRKEESSLKMANTYLSHLPDGSEKGKYLALDLGGTNFRILLVELKSGQMSDVQVQHYHIGDGLRLGPGEDLFDYLAECVCDFLARKQLKGQPIPLGFTFSFPMLKSNLNSGVLVKWTKSFNCSGVEGKDVVRLLREALARKGCYDVTVHAVLNDTTGTLIMGQYMDRKTSIGLILGTGSNACYLEKVERVNQFETKRHGEEVAINVEWGAFGDNGVLDFIQTSYDVEVDSNSLLVNSYTFEKYISGKYLGEVVRVVLVNLIKQGLLFGGYLTNAMNRSDSFSSAMVSRIEECTLNDAREDILQLFETLGVRNVTDDDLTVVQHVCYVVSNRSALLVSICLAELINWIDKPDITVAVDGSLYQKHPRYQFLMEKYMKLFTKNRFKMMEVLDGSGRGAALAAAIAMRLEERFGGC